MRMAGRSISAKPTQRGWKFFFRALQREVETTDATEQRQIGHGGGIGRAHRYRLRRAIDPERVVELTEHGLQNVETAVAAMLELVDGRMRDGDGTSECALAQATLLA